MFLGFSTYGCGERLAPRLRSDGVEWSGTRSELAGLLEGKLHLAHEAVDVLRVLQHRLEEEDGDA